MIQAATQNIHYHHHYYAALVYPGMNVASNLGNLGNPVTGNFPLPALGEPRPEEAAGSHYLPTKFTRLQPEDTADEFIALAAELLWRIGLAGEDEGDPLQVIWELAEQDRRYGGLRGVKRKRWRDHLSTLGAEICLCVLLHHHPSARPYHRVKQQAIRDASAYLICTLDRIAGGVLGNIPDTITQIRATLANLREAAERKGEKEAIRGSESPEPTPPADPPAKSRKPTPPVVEESPDLDVAVAAIEESAAPSVPEPVEVYEPPPPLPPALPEDFDTSWAPAANQRRCEWDLPPCGEDGLPAILALPDCPEGLVKAWRKDLDKLRDHEVSETADREKKIAWQLMMLRETLWLALEHYGHTFAPAVGVAPSEPAKRLLTPDEVAAKASGLFRPIGSKRPVERI